MVAASHRGIGDRDRRERERERERECALKDASIHNSGWDVFQINIKVQNNLA